MDITVNKSSTEGEIIIVLWGQDFYVSLSSRVFNRLYLAIQEHEAKKLAHTILQELQKPKKDILAQEEKDAQSLEI